VVVERVALDDVVRRIEIYAVTLLDKTALPLTSRRAAQDECRLTVRDRDGIGAAELVAVGGTASQRPDLGIEIPRIGDVVVIEEREGRQLPAAGQIGQSIVDG
jgi:hypothetical protein